MNKVFIFHTYNRDTITVVCKDKDRAWEMIGELVRNFDGEGDFGKDALKLMSKKDIEELDLNEEYIH